MSNYEHPKSEEHRRKIKEFANSPKGKELRRIAGSKSSGKYKKGNVPWDVGKKRPEFSGSNNPRWKGGIGYQYWSTIYRPIFNSLEQKCSLCGTTNKLVTHHIDKNYKNNSLSNIMITCSSCHNKIHHKKELK